jgi:phosphoribosylformimino-5-aminoimidazole carboxamide ribonucleotide (ProFAR) isomerase
MEKVLSKTKMKVIASGGVSSLEDIRQLNQLSKQYSHLYGAIVGKALYEKKFTVKEAIAAC